jgi:hypothetical protein
VYLDMRRIAVDGKSGSDQRKQHSRNYGGFHKIPFVSDILKKEL